MPLASIGTIGFVAAANGCGSKSSASDASAACGDYFDAVYDSKCDPARPSSELSRDRGRFLALCEATLALPGLGTAPSQLESCANAVNASGVCFLANGDLSAEPSECASLGSGTLASGVACNTGAQCQSNNCAMTSDGGTLPACGSCTVPIAVGQACGAAAGFDCREGTVCSETSMTCQTVTYGGVGVACGGNVSFCNDGLYCDPTTERCVAGKGAGSACAMAQGDCAPPLVCLGITQVCGNPGTNGASCSGVQDCAPGFGCTGVAGTTGMCAPVSYASAGQPCGALAPCLVGSCPGSGSSDVCPTVIPDGQSCTLGAATTTCDVFATCTNGVCTLAPTACR